VTYRVEWLAAPVLLGAPFLLLIGPIALVAVLVVALAAVMAAGALAGAVLALPYLLVRSVYRRRAERPATDATVPVTHLQQGAHHEPVAA